MYETNPNTSSPLLDPYIGLWVTETDIALDDFRNPGEKNRKVYTTDLHGNRWLAQPGILMYDLPIDEMGLLKAPVITGYVDESHCYRTLEIVDGVAEVPQVVCKRLAAYYGLASEPVSQFQEEPKVLASTVEPEADPLEEWNERQAAIAEADAQAAVLNILAAAAKLAADRVKLVPSQAESDPADRAMAPELIVAVGQAAMMGSTLDVDDLRGKHHRTAPLYEHVGPLTASTAYADAEPEYDGYILSATDVPLARGRHVY